MKFYLCGFIFCAFIAKISADVEALQKEIEDGGKSGELPLYYKNLVEKAKTDADSARQLNYFECLRTGMEVSMYQMYTEFVLGYVYVTPEFIPKAVKMFCPKIHPVFECYKANEMLKMSEHPTDTKFPKLIEFFPIFENLAKFICADNDGEMFVQFANDGIEECEIEKNSPLKKCVELYKSDELTPHPTAEQCGYIQEVQTCVVDVFKTTCTKEKVAEIFLSVSNEFLNQLKCDH